MQNSNINLTLSVAQVNTIMAALVKAPYEMVAELVQAIREQAVSQVSTQSVEDK